VIGMNDIVYMFISSRIQESSFSSVVITCVRAKALSNILISRAWLAAAVVFNEGI